MNVLYVIGIGSQNNNNELRYSLRMLEKNGIGLENVVISGNIPSWVNRKNVICIDCKDIGPQNKHWNMSHKINEAIKALDFGSKDFLYSSDDHFIHKPVDLNAWPRYERGYIYTEQEYAETNGKNPGLYQRAMSATRKLLEDNDFPFVNYVCHMHMHLNAEYWHEAYELMQKYKEDCTYGFEPMAVCNNIQVHKNLELDLDVKHLTKDVKCNSPAEMDNAMCLQPMFSTTDRFFGCGSTLKWFKKNYGEKCSYEI